MREKSLADFAGLEERKYLRRGCFVNTILGKVDGLMTLPSLRRILTDVLDGIQPIREEACVGEELPSLKIKALPEGVQTSLLALQAVYPQLLLSSLDLLDNALVTRYIVEPTDNHPIYYVRSSQSRPSRYTQTTRTVYEVRPIAWHCTCPAFAFSAFSSRTSFDAHNCGQDDTREFTGWGGQMRGGQFPVCKHLMAVLIGERLNVIPSRQVDKDTLADYAFGAAG
jgi:hypothetical protein